MKPRNLIIFLGLLISGCNCQLKSDEDIEDNSGMLAITKNQFQTHKSPIAGYRGTDEFISSNRSLSNVNETELESNGTRKGKFFSLFTVIKFANDDCVTTSNDNGTCYSANECSLRGGVASGSCARGFGVCCTFTYSCGQTTSQNSSYFSNPDYPSTYDATGSCQLTVNKASRDVCQIRLDFHVMIMRQPESNDSTCYRDQFIVTGGSRVPSICGTNTGQHMYIETGLLGNNPVTLTAVTSGTGNPRQWRIKVTQISCDSPSRAPNSCLQYFTGVSGTIRSFNYDGSSGRQLSNQEYTICIRTESNFCNIAYMLCSGSVYSITGPTGGSATAAGTPVGALVGSTTCNSDWLTIPCSSDNGRPIQSGNTVCQDRLCGDAFASIVTTTSGTVISNVRPFTITVHFNGFEANVPTSVTGVAAQFNNRGFCLSYIQQPCTS